jgi:hypothetical protein
LSGQVGNPEITVIGGLHPQKFRGFWESVMGAILYLLHSQDEFRGSLALSGFDSGFSSWMNRFQTSAAI